MICSTIPLLKHAVQLLKAGTVMVDTNARLAKRLLCQSTPITTAFMQHDCATEHHYIIPGIICYSLLISYAI